jgi:hypothetical protein
MYTVRARVHSHREEFFLWRTGHLAYILPTFGIFFNGNLREPVTNSFDRKDPGAKVVTCCRPTGTALLPLYLTLPKVAEAFRLLVITR